MDSRWRCAPGEPGSGCGAVWHTACTAGCCPGCSHYWTMTQCLACKPASPRERWYHFPPPEDAGERATDKALEVDRR